MADVHEPAIRSYNMSRIKGKNTKPELLVRKFLHSQGFRFRIHDKRFPGRPDIVLPKYRCIINVQGCFWHGHEGCQYFKIPQTRKEWWLEKINKNRQRDKENAESLRDLGWKVIEIWECGLRPNQRQETLTDLINEIQTSN